MEEPEAPDVHQEGNDGNRPRVRQEVEEPEPQGGSDHDVRGISDHRRAAADVRGGDQAEEERGRMEAEDRAHLDRERRHEHQDRDAVHERGEEARESAKQGEDPDRTEPRGS